MHAESQARFPGLRGSDDPLEEFLCLAADSACKVEDVLSALLERCLDISGSRRGLVVLDSLLLGAEDIHHVISYILEDHQPQVLEATAIDGSARRDIRDLMGSMAGERKRPHVVLSPLPPGGNLSYESFFALIASSQYSLTLPIKIKNKHIGWMVLGSTETTINSRALGKVFDRLVSCSVLAIHRKSLGEYARKNWKRLAACRKERKASGGRDDAEPGFST